jgi:hypothetical protein
VEQFWFDTEIIEIKMRLPICLYFKWVGDILKLPHPECGAQFLYMRFHGFGRLTRGSTPYINQFSLKSLEMRCVSPGESARIRLGRISKFV